MIGQTTLWLPKDLVLAAQTAAKGNQETVVNYSSLRAAIEDILKSDPQAIGFGEIHPDPGFNYKSTKARFAEEVLPILAKHRIKVIVLESILSDPAIEAELNKYFDTGCGLDPKNLPVLFGNIDYSDKADLIKILEKCRRLGIRVQAGGMTLSQARATIKNPNYLNDMNLKNEANRFNGAAMRAKVGSLLKRDPKLRFATFGGLLHNDVAVRDQGINFGGVLSGKLGGKYVEVDLLAPEEIKTIRASREFRDLALKFPKSGITSVKRGASVILLFAQRSN